MADNEEQKRQRMVEQFKRALYLEDITWQWSNSQIHCVFHFPGQQGSNEDQIMTFDNRASARVFIYRYQQEHPDIFYYSTDRNDLVVDPARDPNKRKPKLGSYEPPPPDPKDPQYQARRHRMKNRFDEKLAALDKRGKSLGKIFYRWFHIDSERQARNNPKPIPIENTAAVRRLFEEEKVRCPHEFYYSCDEKDLTVDKNNLTLPPKMGSLFPRRYQSEADSGGHNGFTIRPRSSAPATVSVPPGAPHRIRHSPSTSGGPPTKRGKFGSKSPAVLTGPSSSAASQPWFSPPPMHQSPHFSAAPVPSVYFARSGTSSASAMPELIVPPPAMSTTTPATSNFALDASHLIPAEMLSANWDALIAEHQAQQDVYNRSLAPIATSDVDHLFQGEIWDQLIAEQQANQNLHNTFLGQMNPIDEGVGAADLDKIITTPTANQDQFNEILGDLNQLIQPEANNALPVPLPNMDEPLNDEGNAFVDDIAAQEGDAAMLGNALMMGMMGADYNPYAFPPHNGSGHQSE